MGKRSIRHECNPVRVSDERALSANYDCRGVTNACVGRSDLLAPVCIEQPHADDGDNEMCQKETRAHHRNAKSNRRKRNGKGDTAAKQRQRPDQANGIRAGRDGTRLFGASATDACDTRSRARCLKRDHARHGTRRCRKLLHVHGLRYREPRAKVARARAFCPKVQAGG